MVECHWWVLLSLSKKGFPCCMPKDLLDHQCLLPRKWPNMEIWTKLYGMCDAMERVSFRSREVKPNYGCSNLKQWFNWSVVCWVLLLRRGWVDDWRNHSWELRLILAVGCLQGRRFGSKPGLWDCTSTYRSCNLNLHRRVITCESTKEVKIFIDNAAAVSPARAWTGWSGGWLNQCPLEVSHLIIYLEIT